MAIRSGFKVNVKANIASTRSDSIFVDVKADTTKRVRFLPPTTGDGTLFTKIVNHFRLKTDDDPPRGMAVGCNAHFENEPCYLCNLSQTLKRHGDKAERKIGDEIRASARFYAPVLEAEKDENDEWVYDQKVKLIGLPKTAVEEISALLVQQDMVGDDFFCDVEKGQDLLITRTGTGFNTKYKISLTGIKMDLAEIAPEVEAMEDVVAACSLNMHDNESQKAAARRTFGDDLDWDELASQFNL